ncbi:MAG: membrane protein insertase YidC [Acidobacteriia bacterium]|nr:membrane protein insertase YidC [Terriglobia bacterium]
MSQSVNGGNKDAAETPKEMSMEVRLLLAFLLMGAVMFLTPYFYKSPPPAPTKKTPAAAAPAAPAPAPAPATAAAPAPQQPAARPAASASATPQQAQPPYIIDTDLYRIAFNNQGATVRSWLLKKYRGNDGKPLDLMNSAAKMEWPFSLYFPAEKPAENVNWTYYKQTPDADGLGIAFEYTNGPTTVRKSFRFQKNKYVSEVKFQVTVDGRPIPSMIAWRGGFGDLTIANPSAAQRALYFNAADNKLVEQNAKTAKDGPVTSSGDYTFAGIADTYFAAVFLREGGSSMQETVFSDTVATALEEKPAAFPGAAISAGTASALSLFVGPKDLDVLKGINPKLEAVVDFGWLSILAKPLFLITNFVNDAFVHNFGWSIVLVTILIYMVLFPIRISSMKSMRKMQALKPQIDVINSKYKNLKFNDPKKTEQQQETMDLYKKHGVNPMGGCLPTVISLLLIIPFYKVFQVAVEMRGASWLWVTDLSQPEHLPIKILPVAMIITQFLTQKMMPTPSADPNQQRMMMFMPLIFGFMFYNFPSGLVLYYLTGNLVSMGQQWFFNRTETAQEAVRSVQPAPKKKIGRK